MLHNILSLQVRNAGASDVLDEHNDEYDEYNYEYDEYDDLVRVRPKDAMFLLKQYADLEAVWRNFAARFPHNKKDITIIGNALIRILKSFPGSGYLIGGIEAIIENPCLSEEVLHEAMLERADPAQTKYILACKAASELEIKGPAREFFLKSIVELPTLGLDISKPLEIHREDCQDVILGNILHLLGPAARYAVRQSRCVITRERKLMDKDEILELLEQSDDEFLKTQQHKKPKTKTASIVYQEPLTREKKLKNKQEMLELLGESDKSLEIERLKFRHIKGRRKSRRK